MHAKREETRFLRRLIRLFALLVLTDIPAAAATPAASTLAASLLAASTPAASPLAVSTPAVSNPVSATSAATAHSLSIPAAPTSALRGAPAASTPSIRPSSAAVAAPSDVDTTIRVDGVQITAVKQGLSLRSEPVASTIVGTLTSERRRVTALKELGTLVPNLHLPDYGSRMTSSVYVRGMGTRIDHPVIGLNIDNVPVLNKNCFDTELADIERIEVLRGPQSTLYGRNTMGGVVNVYTLSPFTYQGLRLLLETAGGDEQRLRASLYRRLGERTAISVTGFYGHRGGFYRNAATGGLCDRERLFGGRWKMQWRNGAGLRIDNTFSFTVGDEGGYPYAFAGGRSEALGDDRIAVGRIAYNDPCSYERTAVSDGLTVQYAAGRWSLTSISSWQYTDDDMHLDQDFLPLDYFTLRQALRETVLTEDLIFRSQGERRYGWLFGLYGFHRTGRMQAPVNILRDGVDALVFAAANEAAGGRIHLAAAEDMPLESSFRLPVSGVALYHESTLRFGRFEAKAGLRIDYERTRLRYDCSGALSYTLQTGAMPQPVLQPAVALEEQGRLAHSYAELLPKASLIYRFDEERNIYLSASRGYKAGGFNTQIFSDRMQEKLRAAMQHTDFEERDVLSYKPEYSWNYEAGVHFSCAGGLIRGDAALFRIDCRDQQLTVFPDASSTGRMMTNAGRTRSVGAELALQLHPCTTLQLYASYGYTEATFRRYDDGRADYAGRTIPYAPRETLAAGFVWRIPTGVSWLGDAVLQGSLRGTGRIYWDEANTLSQPFCTLFDASVRFEHERYSLDLWGRNLGDRRYDVFSFESVGNRFVQRGRPRQFGITLSIHL